MGRPTTYDLDCYAAEKQAYDWTIKPLITVADARDIIAKQCEFFGIDSPIVTSKRARRGGRWGGGTYYPLACRLHLRTSPTNFQPGPGDMLKGKAWTREPVTPLFTVLHELAHHACCAWGLNSRHSPDFRAVLQRIANTWGYAFKLQARAGAIADASPVVLEAIQEKKL